MPQKPENPTSQKNKELIKPPSPVDSVAAPRTKEQFKLAKGVDIKKPRNFDKALKRLKETGSLSLDDFNNAKDIGAFIDWYNKMRDDSKQKYNDNEILEISKLLAKLMTQKTIFLNTPQKD